MYGNINRTSKYIRNLSDFIQRVYKFAPVALVPAKRGYYGETWRYKSKDDIYFVKIDYSPHKMLYERSFSTIEYLCNHGIDFISRVVKTADGSLYTQYDGAILGIFEWIDGENVQNEQTKIKEYQMLARIYTVPYRGLNLLRENFTTGSSDLFFNNLERLKNNSSKTDTEKIINIFERNRVKLIYRAERLTQFAKKCRTDTSHFYITHGDAGGNIIVNEDRYYMIDWDEPIIAPPERDAWFCIHWNWATSAFNDAFGENSIDYTLRPERLAYYCYHMFFVYLNNYIETYFDIGNGNNDMAAELTEYFNCWIEDNINFAENIKG